jgi:DNA replication protein DnaC
MTSNRPIQDWGKLIGDVPSAAAILDRFLHCAVVIPMKGRSYRLKDAPWTPTQDDKGACAAEKESF